MLTFILILVAFLLLAALGLILYAQLVPPVEVDPTDEGLLLTIRRRSIANLHLVIEGKSVRNFSRIPAGKLTIAWSELPIDHQAYLHSQVKPAIKIVGRSTLLWFAADVICSCQTTVQSVSQITRYSFNRPARAAA